MDIFIIRTSEVGNFSEEFLKKFQKKEISNKQTLKTHCLTYAMLDSILRGIYKLENREIIYEGKKPVLRSRSKYFSLSHSSELIAIAVSNYNCGIDIEQRKERNYEAISKRMGFESSTQEEFYHNWTFFEAKYKLAETEASSFIFPMEDYYLTAVSSNANEKFELFIS